MRAHKLLKTGAALLAASCAIAGGAALAASYGHPEPAQLGYQLPATDIAERVFSLSHMLHWVAALITLFVTVLLAYACIKFSAKNNPTPARFTHNTTIEVLWTIVPVIILVLIAIPSIRLLYYQETVPPAGVTVKAIGHQWRWEYMYDIDGEEVYVDSRMAGYGDSNFATYDEMKTTLTAYNAENPDEPEIIPSLMEWKLKATAPMVVPVDTIIRVQVTAADVLHAWTVPSFGVKTDAVPGRLNEVWFEAKETGIYFGQCSELCGKDHSYMPIEVHVVSSEEYGERLEGIKERFASKSTPEAVKVAASAAAQ